MVAQPYISPCREVLKPKAAHVDCALEYNHAPELLGCTTACVVEGQPYAPSQ